MKKKTLLLSLALSTAVFVGCANQAPVEDPVQDPTQTEEQTTQEGADNVAAASLNVKDEDVFEASIGEQGTWIVAIIEDLNFDKELVLEGEFTNGKKNDDGTDQMQRKIALYTQDEDRNVTNRFTLTAPKLTIKSPEAKIQSGTFVGDLYVESENFQLVDTKVEGNVYFTTQEAKDTFKMDEKSNITGKQELRK